MVRRLVGGCDNDFGREDALTGIQKRTTGSSVAKASDTLMFAEARSAGEAVERLLRSDLSGLEALVSRLRERPPAVVVTCARGSSDHAATYAKYLLESMVGVPVSSAALSIASVYRAPVAQGSSLCVAISQSGRSPDLLAGVEAQRRAGATVLALVNDETSPLASMADVVLPLCAGPERAVAATKSFITALAAIALLAARWSQDRSLAQALDTLPQRLLEAFELDWSPAVEQLRHARNLFVLGRGHTFGIAQEAALKMKETCGLHAEAFSAAEVRHGPMAIVGEGFPILGFANSDAAGDGVCVVAGVLAGRGAAVSVADPSRRVSDGCLPAIRSHPAVEPILMIQSFYRMANELSVGRGFNPDAPPFLSKVTRTV